MTLIRVDTPSSSQERATGLAAMIHQILVDHAGVEPTDRFYIVNSAGQSFVMFDRTHLGVERDAGFAAVQIFHSLTLDAQQKADLMVRIEQGVRRVGFKPENMLVSLVQTDEGDWSYGNASIGSVNKA